MTNWTTGVCRADGADIHYLRTGGVLPPIVLLHGLTANGACWTPLARSLENEFDVVMPDARGHGKSTAPLDGYRYDDHASDVVTIIETLGLAAPVLLGHSMGGMTAAVVASRLGKDLTGVILVDPTFLSLQRQREVCDSDVAGQHRRMLGQSKHALLTDARNRHAHRPAEIVELQVDARLQTHTRAFDVLTPPNPDHRQLVSAMQVPVLLVIGDAGAVVSPATARDLQSLNPSVRIEQINDAGHGLPYDQPARLEIVVKAFLKSIVAC